MMRWLLVGAHALYVTAHALVASSDRLLADWHPVDALRPMREANAPAPASNAQSPATAALVAPLRTGPLPFHHARKRAAVPVHLLCLALALLACWRIQPQVERELSGVLQAYAPSLATRASLSEQHLHQRNAQEDADVAQLHRRPQGRKSNSARHTAVSSPAFSEGDDGSALVAVIFHLLGLMLSFAHMIFFSGWSRIDPRRRWTAPAGLGLSRHAATHFLATTVTAHLMLLTHAVTLTCLLRTGGSGGSGGGEAAVHDVSDLGEGLDPAMVRWMLADGQEDDDALVAGIHRQLSPQTLITALCFLPYFILHLHRFALNALLWWRFRSFFPRVGLVKRATTATATATGSVRGGGSQRSARSAAQSAKARRQQASSRREQAAQAADASDHSDASSSDSSSDSDIDDSLGAPLDASDLRSLASFADDGASADSAGWSAEQVAAALADDPSGDALMAPTPLMQRLRNTPKLQQLMAQQQQDEQKAIERQRRAQELASGEHDD